MRSAISPNDPRVAVLVSALDVEGTPMAQTWRAVGAALERVGLRRCSYQHVRRLVRIERRRRELERQRRAVWGDAAKTLAAGRVPSAVHVLERLQELEGRKELVVQEHKAFGQRSALESGPGAAPAAEGRERGGGEGPTGPGRRSRGP